MTILHPVKTWSTSWIWHEPGEDLRTAHVASGVEVAGDCDVRLCGSRGAKSPRPIDPSKQLKKHRRRSAWHWRGGAK